MVSAATIVKFASAPEAAPNFTCDPVFHETRDTHGHLRQATFLLIPRRCAGVARERRELVYTTRRACDSRSWLCGWCPARHRTSRKRSGSAFLVVIPLDQMAFVRAWRLRGPTQLVCSYSAGSRKRRGSPVAWAAAHRDRTFHQTHRPHPNGRAASSSLEAALLRFRRLPVPLRTLRCNCRVRRASGLPSSAAAPTKFTAVSISCRKPNLRDRRPPKARLVVSRPVN